VDREIEDDGIECLMKLESPSRLCCVEDDNRQAANQSPADIRDTPKRTKVIHRHRQAQLLTVERANRID
jgi:hypothetical protein